MYIRAYEGLGQIPEDLRDFEEDKRRFEMAKTEHEERLASLKLPPKLTRVIDTASPPFRCICRIHVRTTKGGNSIGTGVLISRYHVLTCAHVLYDRWDPHPKEVTVLPGQNGPDDKRPPIRADGWAVSPGWRWNDCRTANEDLGIIRLAHPSDAGFWPFAPFEPSIVTAAAAHIAGYPVRMDDKKAHWMYRSRSRFIGRIQIDSCSEPKPPKKEGMLFGTLFQDISDTTKLIAHEADTGPSMSGGPVWTFREGKRVLFALHAGVIDDGAKKKAILLNTTVRKRITEWMTQGLPPLDSGPR
jgi:V8-like Glu-specific endopeptidase